MDEKKRRKKSIAVEDCQETRQLSPHTVSLCPLEDTDTQRPDILLFGASSLLGFTLARLYANRVIPFVSPGNGTPAVSQWPALQLHDSHWIKDIFRRISPRLVVYCHAVCDVPKCQAAPEWAYEINVRQLMRVLALLPEQTRCVYVSSDHVFGGDGVYTEASSPCPISVYGITRARAEELVLRRPGSLVIRVGLGIGSSPDGRKGHLNWIRYRMAKGLPITIIHDEFRSAVWTSDLATRVMQLALSREEGLCHIPATRAVSRVELATHLFRLLGLPPTFRLASRRQQPVPHLGRVELASLSSSPLAAPLPSALDTGFDTTEIEAMPGLE
ncbi:MAG: NAD-dependent epimerase/dehydratase family protein [Nitrospirae bacterium]|nr:MAG: NAD-dependent epimerase/dehydratase family protein [Nitrospirota bacterium]